MEIKEAVQIAMGVFAQSIDQMSDLKGCLLQNDTTEPFVTSDDPAVFVNRWLTQIRPSVKRSFGLTSAGAIAVLPLTPALAFLAYDSDVYTVNEGRGELRVRHPSDVEAINALQYLNCRANIYVRDEAYFEQVRSHFMAQAPYRPKVRFATHYAVKDREFEGSVRYVRVDRTALPDDEDAIVHSEVIHIRPTSWPRFLRWKPNGSAYALGPGRTLVRRSIAEASPELESERVRTGVA